MGLPPLSEAADGAAVKWVHHETEAYMDSPHGSIRSGVAWSARIGDYAWSVRLYRAGGDVVAHGRADEMGAAKSIATRVAKAMAKNPKRYEEKA